MQAKPNRQRLLVRELYQNGREIFASERVKDLKILSNLFGFLSRTANILSAIQTILADKSSPQTIHVSLRFQVHLPRKLSRRNLTPGHRARLIRALASRIASTRSTRSGTPATRPRWVITTPISPRNFKQPPAA